ncbi:aspartate aminotransferase family protein [Spelaeicoccus albus]|uniref:4-aminobutyrate aminotransferase-like enzyme n=1 Tax=Spelaeicoccus albus TaxID=1280376 RepID=A0A7Z0IHR6_9MICO|nr:aspartate aminotransferase family protein [Spelaeicoccus albus]NYI67938.1 4-aminobutyrate aminotransferase-like enzyme [Spelaeicoccus albus]
MGGNDPASGGTAAADDLLCRRRRALAASYRLFYDEPVHLVRGDGCWLFDADGERYLDAYNNVAVVGHARAEVVDAMYAQAARLNTHTRYLSEPVVEYAERLLAHFPAHLAQAIFTCTGSEANDLACRIATSWTGRAGFIVTKNAYHGTTTATAALSPSLHADTPASVRTVAAPNPREEGAEAAGRFAADVTAAAERLHADGVGFAGLIVDTILSSEGVWAEPRGLLAPAADAAHAAGGLVIADEVQAGFGRLGDGMWGFARHDLRPDLVTLGKPMGNGHPISGVIGRRDVFDAFGSRERYFNTFGGNPVSAAVGLAVLDVIERDGLVAHAGATGAHMRAELTDLASRHPGIGDVRGSGLFLAVELADPETGAPASERTARVVNEMRRERVLISATGPSGNVLKIRPPLVFDAEQSVLLSRALDDALTATEA